MNFRDQWLAEKKQRRKRRVDQQRRGWRDMNWYRREADRINSFAMLKQDWNSSGTDRPNDVAIQLLLRVLAELNQLNMPPKWIDPSVEEGICIAFASGSRYADIECFNDGQMLAITSVGDNPNVWNVEAFGLVDSILRICENIYGHNPGSHPRIVPDKDCESAIRG